MVQQISALIVQPAVDASKYTAGAQEKVAADKAMAAGAREVGAVATDTSAKINQSGDILARLSRQYIEGYGAQQRFEQGLRQLNRGLEIGKITAEGAERILIGMNQRLGLAANAADLAAKGQMSLAAAVERANVQIARQASDLAAAEAANRRMQAANSNVISDGARRAAGFNAGQQLQDIGMMALVGQRRSELFSINAQFEADQQMARARTNAERLAAAEAQVRARAREDGDTGGGLQARVDRALAQERTRQEVEARDATIQRSQALERTLQQQRLELDLIGKTGVEQAKLRFEFERMQELREQAARTGAPINDEEVAAIKAAAEAMGQYADAIARAKLAGELQFEREQLFRSPQDQQIASRLRGAGLPVDLNGPIAQQMRDNQTFADMKGLTSGFLNDFKGSLVSSGGDIGEAFGNAIQNALLKSADMYLSDVFDHLATMFARSMTGQAAPFGTPDGFAQMLGIGIKGSSSGGVLGSANDNLDIAGYIRQAAVARNIDPNIALRVARSEGLAPGIWQSNVIRNGIREPSYGPFQLLKGGAGTGFPSGLGNAFQSATGLDPANPANVRPGIDFALNHAAGNGWGAWYGAKAAGVGNWEGLQGASTKAVGSLDRLATSSIDTANDLRSGLGNLGNALNQFPSAPGSGGLLGNLLGGLNSAFSGSRAFNWLSSSGGASSTSMPTAPKTLLPAGHGWVSAAPN